MRHFANILILSFAVLFLAGFGKSKVDLVKGVWKTERSDGGRVEFIEIMPTYIDMVESGLLDGIVLEEKDGVVVVRKAGMDDVFGRILISDDNHIIFESMWFWGRVTLIRSSVEEKLAVLNPPIKNAIGLYKDANGTLILNITEQTIVRNGKTLETKLVSGNRRYSGMNGDVREFVLTPIGDGRLQYEGSDFDTKILEKITDTEASQLLTRIENEHREKERAKQEELSRQLARIEDENRMKERARQALKKAANDLFQQSQGFWAIKEQSANAPWSVMEITKNSVTIKGQKTHVTETVMNGYATFCSVLQPANPFLTLKSISKDGSAITVTEWNNDADYFSGPKSRDLVYQRTTEKEVRLHNEPQLTDLSGAWQLEQEGAGVYNLLAFQDNYIMRDRHVEPIEAAPVKTVNLIYRHGTKNKYEMLRICHTGINQIKVRYGIYDSDPWFSYKRLTEEEGNALVGRTTDAIAKLSGYWRSEKPAWRDNFAYLAIALNQSVNNSIMDVFEHFHMDEYNKGVNRITGYLGFFLGKVNQPIYLINDLGRHLHHNFAFVDDNTIEYRFDPGSIKRRFVRTSEADAKPLIEKRK